MKTEAPEEIDYQELFNRLAKPGERFDDDWVECIDDGIDTEGELVARHEWDSGGPGAGAGVVDVCKFRGLFFASNDVGSYGPYEGFTEAAEAVALLTVTNATTRIWVDYPEGRKNPKRTADYQGKRRKQRL